MSNGCHKYLTDKIEPLKGPLWRYYSCPLAPRKSFDILALYKLDYYYYYYYYYKKSQSANEF